MRNLLWIAVCLAVLPQFAAGEDYILTINGAETALDLEQPTTVELPDGTSLKLLLRQKEYLRFKSDLFSFEHHNKYKPSRNDLGGGIFQTMAVTPLGTGILVQEYMSMNPQTLIDTMLHELTKEEIEYGYKYDEKPVTQKVGEVTLSGKQAVTTYPGEEWTRIVLAYGKKDRGLLVMTFIEKDNAAEQQLIDHFWKTFEVNEKLR